MIRFARAPNGQVYVKVKDSGIPPLCLLTDGISHHFFGSEKTPYLLVEDAAAWHVKEAPHSKNAADHLKAAVVLRNAVTLKETT